MITDESIYSVTSKITTTALASNRGPDTSAGRPKPKTILMGACFTHPTDFVIQTHSAQGRGQWVSRAIRSAIRSRISRRSIIMSRAPCSSRNSLR